MPIYHVQMKFATPDFGWVEQWYRFGTSFGNALAAAQALALARYQILGQGVQLYRVRVTQPGVPHASWSVDISGATLSTQAMSALEGAEILLSAGTERRHNRSYFLRGLPVGSLLNPTGPASWASFIEGPVTAWLTLLTSGGWYSRCRGYVGPKYPITGLILLQAPGSNYDLPDGGPEGPTIYSTAGFASLQGQPTVPPTDTSFGVPPMVRIGRARWTDLWAAKQTPVNGEFPAIAAFDNSLQYLARLPESGEYAGGGYAQVSQQVFLPITRTLLRRGGVRKCGGPGRDAPPPGPVGTFGSPVISGLAELVLPFLSPFQAIVDLAEEITPLVVAPPVVAGDVPPPYPEPVSATLTNAQESLRFIYDQLTFSGEGENYKPIGIARVQNLSNCWWVGLAGFYPTENTDTGYLAALSGGLGQLNTYAETVIQTILEEIPADATIVLQGFSLGGITAENVSQTVELRPRVAQVVTFGSPMTGVSFVDFPITRLKCAADQVPGFTPLGLASVLSGHRGYTIIPRDPKFPTMPGCHTRMSFNFFLADLDNWGLPPANRPPFVLGTLTKFRPNP